MTYNGFGEKMMKRIEDGQKDHRFMFKWGTFTDRERPCYSVKVMFPEDEN